MAEVFGLDSLTIATQGLLTGNPLLVAAQGLLAVDIVIVDPTPPEDVVVDTGGGGIVDGAPHIKDYTKEEKKKLRSRITVTAIIDGKKYKETLYSKDLNVSVDDVGIDIDHNAPKPIIKITVKKKQ